MGKESVDQETNAGQIRILIRVGSLELKYHRQVIIIVYMKIINETNVIEKRKSGRI